MLEFQYFEYRCCQLGFSFFYRDVLRMPLITPRGIGIRIIGYHQPEGPKE
jgi:hypothetical protein